LSPKKSHIILASVIVLLTFSFQLSTFNCVAQDIHFSQFFNSPLNLNPGLAGNFIGDFRIVANQRTQWSSVTTPYSTYSLAADAKHIYKTPFNVGLSVYHDKAGDSDFSTLQVGLSLGYTQYIGDSSHTLSVGIQPAYVQRSINYNELQFDNQYNGSFYNSSLSNGENFGNNGRNYFNFHSGINWNYNIAQRKSVNAGFAVHNITQPQQTFFSENIPLKQRYTFHAGGLIKVHNKVDVLPRFIIASQHKYKEIIFGGSAKYHLNNGNYKNIYAGLYYRNSDAAYITLGLDYRSFHAKVSYDINISTLEVASNNRGGFELAIIYIFERYRPVIRRYKACPNFL